MGFFFDGITKTFQVGDDNTRYTVEGNVYHDYFQRLFFSFVSEKANYIMERNRLANFIEKSGRSLSR